MYVFIVTHLEFMFVFTCECIMSCKIGLSINNVGNECVDVVTIKMNVQIHIHVHTHTHTHTHTHEKVCAHKIIKHRGVP